MSKKTLREISYEYARERGGGLPLTAEELCNCVVLWVQQYVEETPSKIVLKAEDIAGLLEGSETVVVDLNEAGNAIEIHLDGDIVNKIDRAILQPISNPIEDSVPVVGDNGVVTYKPYNEALYVHRIVDSNVNKNVLTVVCNRAEAFSNNTAQIIPYSAVALRYGYNTTDLEGHNVVAMQYVPAIGASPAYFRVYYYSWDDEEHKAESFYLSSSTQYSVSKY